jgi:cell wall-associated NlpC family hydrolase
VLRALLISAAVLLPAAPTAQAAVYGVPPRAEHRALQPTLGRRAVELALRLRGVPYVWAGATPAGFDCSGFTRYVYGRLGIRLPHSSYGQWSLGRHVRRRQVRPGDLVFFASESHVGIYVGHGRFIHAPESGRVVSLAPLDSGWYAATYSGAVRLPGTQRRRPWEPARATRPPIAGFRARRS